MSLSSARILYGIHSITPRNRISKIPYGILKVVGSANIALTSELEQLYAGSSKAPWAAESKNLSTEISAKVKAYPGFLFALFLGATVTDTAADSAGNVTALVNALGTSCFSATIGVASVAIIPTTGKANLKFGKYVLKALSASTVGIFIASDIDFARGTDVVYVDDTLQVGTAVTITTGATSTVTDLGIQLVGGSGTITLVIGDTATFEVKPPSTGSTLIKIGGATSTMPAFEAVMLSQKRSNGEMFEITAFNCVGAGLPIAMEELAFSQPELKAVALFDSTEDAVLSIRHMTPESV